jgi:hypothetical protein
VIETPLTWMLDHLRLAFDGGRPVVVDLANDAEMGLRAARVAFPRLKAWLQHDSRRDLPHHELEQLRERVSTRARLRLRNYSGPK